MRDASNGAMAERIAAIALECFGEHGFDGTSMRDLAARLEVTPAALYYHYAGKDDLLEAVLDPLLRELETLIADAEQRRPTGPAEQRSRLENLLEVLLHQPDVLRLMVSDVGVASHERVRGRVGELTRRLPELLLREDPSSVERVRAWASIGALLRPILGLEDGELAAHTEEVVDAACRALGLPRRRRSSPA
jgi:AcrR family transcriptional regulator